MTTYSWSQYAKTAKEHSGGPTLPAGTGYVGEIIDAGAKIPKSGKPRLSWKFKVLVGPLAGKTETMFQSLSVDNPAALAAFYGVLGRLGIDLESVPDGTPPEAIAKLAIGGKFQFDIEHRADKTDATKLYTDFKNLKRIDDTPAAPPAPPVAAPAPAPAPAPEQASSDVAALQAQLAALQAQQAVAAAETPAAAAPKLPF